MDLLITKGFGKLLGTFITTEVALVVCFPLRWWFLQQFQELEVQHSSASEAITEPKALSQCPSATPILAEPTIGSKGR